MSIRGARLECMTAPTLSFTEACTEPASLAPPLTKAEIPGTHRRKRNNHSYISFVFSLPERMLWSLCIRTEITADAFIQPENKCPLLSIVLALHCLSLTLIAQLLCFFSPKAALNEISNKCFYLLKPRISSRKPNESSSSSMCRPLS